MNESLLAEIQEALSQPGAAESPLGRLLQSLLQKVCHQHDSPLEPERARRTVGGHLPVCYCCKKIRDAQGRWDEVESFLSKNSEAVLGQAICPGCIQESMTTLAMPRRQHTLPDSQNEKALFASLVADGVSEDNPLLGPHLELARRYAKVSRRLDKISKISDGFQSQLKELNGSLQRASLTDSLTGIANRRAMLERLKAEANRTDRSGEPFSVLMLDLDWFKKVNDTHGHEAGDLVIVAVAQTLENNLRNFDFCARWGGEEFLILLTTTSLTTATTVSEKLRHAVAALEISYGGERIPVSFSGGLALHSGGAVINATLRNADRALYEAKSSGRNKVMLGENTQLD